MRLSRRIFLQGSLLGIGVLIFYKSDILGAVSPMQTIALVQEDLFPHAKNLGVNTQKYLTLILNHSKVTTQEKSFLRNGVQWLNEEALLLHKKMYVRLAEDERQSVLLSISKQKWGKQWIDKMLTFIMEASLSDQIYGVNPNSATAKWLGFEAGFPRPKEAYL